ncbi:MULTISPECIES: succinate dehydrogenase, hydrophobic membrane anchor protein [unclassified Pseudoclavibacter]|uniref:succinate dehydrogenase, hydrophobic membrane anchor protein n=1 Tax=unclassified Pseudoclavibacter TaxID=2615177 RepID=UPI0012F29764|nr:MULTISPECIES: succinate dehydrogenase, hydrophobic membrane anchor protein [unclassified Pseudoclavibacter]MBF4458459.1 succinate dehydrogenase, hydrophobic membrane anchor protein [Pseudoclavibacter sp. VKM Ac-2867]MBF4552293.1 succinate dehydrogenase, hydrophobic membrane anchor protein [Pseudoclavibacter sp. VKM Ac-2888]VXB55893.1 Succinate dehydrogenase, hydrophobic membrane anchor protein [Pseudoclavibacter sp. 8L]
MTIETIEYPRSAAAAKNSTNWERIGWAFMRVSGVLLVILIFGHLFTNLMVGQGVAAIDFAFVAGKMADPFWVVWDTLMLVLAFIHGANGMRTIINDYVSKASTRRALQVTLFLVTTVLIVLGLLVIYTFDPCPANGAAENLPSFCPA